MSRVPSPANPVSIDLTKPITFLQYQQYLVEKSKQPAAQPIEQPAPAEDAAQPETITIKGELSLEAFFTCLENKNVEFDKIVLAGNTMHPRLDEINYEKFTSKVFVFETLNISQIEVAPTFIAWLCEKYIQKRAGSIIISEKQLQAFDEWHKKTKAGEAFPQLGIFTVLYSNNNISERDLKKYRSKQLDCLRQVTIISKETLSAQKSAIPAFRSLALESGEPVLLTKRNEGPWYSRTKKPGYKVENCQLTWGEYDALKAMDVREFVDVSIVPPARANVASESSESMRPVTQTILISVDEKRTENRLHALYQCINKTVNGECEIKDITVKFTHNEGGEQISLASDKPYRLANVDFSGAIDTIEIPAFVFGASAKTAVKISSNHAKELLNPMKFPVRDHTKPLAGVQIVGGELTYDQIASLVALGVCEFNGVAVNLDKKTELTALPNSPAVVFNECTIKNFAGRVNIVNGDDQIGVSDSDYLSDTTEFFGLLAGKKELDFKSKKDGVHLNSAALKYFLLQTDIEIANVTMTEPLDLSSVGKDVANIAQQLKLIEKLSRVRWERKNLADGKSEPAQITYSRGVILPDFILNQCEDKKRAKQDLATPKSSQPRAELSRYLQKAHNSLQAKSAPQIPKGKYCFPNPHCLSSTTLSNHDFEQKVKVHGLRDCRGLTIKGNVDLSTLRDTKEKRRTLKNLDLQNVTCDKYINFCDVVLDRGKLNGLQCHGIIINEGTDFRNCDPKADWPDEMKLIFVSKNGKVKAKETTVCKLYAALTNSSNFNNSKNNEKDFIYRLNENNRDHKKTSIGQKLFTVLQHMHEHQHAWYKMGRRKTDRAHEAFAVALKDGGVFTEIDDLDAYCNPRKMSTITPPSSVSSVSAQEVVMSEQDGPDSPRRPTTFVEQRQQLRTSSPVPVPINSGDVVAPGAQHSSRPGSYRERFLVSQAKASDPVEENFETLDSKTRLRLENAELRDRVSELEETLDAEHRARLGRMKRAREIVISVFFKADTTTDWNLVKQSASLLTQHSEEDVQDVDAMIAVANEMMRVTLKNFRDPRRGFSDADYEHRVYAAYYFLYHVSLNTRSADEYFKEALETLARALNEFPTATTTEITAAEETKIVSAYLFLNAIHKIPVGRSKNPVLLAEAEINEALIKFDIAKTGKIISAHRFLACLAKGAAIANDDQAGPKKYLQNAHRTLREALNGFDHKNPVDSDKILAAYHFLNAIGEPTNAFVNAANDTLTRASENYAEFVREDSANKAKILAAHHFLVLINKPHASYRAAITTLNDALLGGAAVPSAPPSTKKVGRSKRSVSLPPENPDFYHSVLLFGGDDDSTEAQAARKKLEDHTISSYQLIEAIDGPAGVAAYNATLSGNILWNYLADKVYHRKICNAEGTQIRWRRCNIIVRLLNAANVENARLLGRASDVRDQRNTRSPTVFHATKSPEEKQLCQRLWARTSLQELVSAKNPSCIDEKIYAVVQKKMALYEHLKSDEKLFLERQLYIAGLINADKLDDAKNEVLAMIVAWPNRSLHICAEGFIDASIDKVAEVLKSAHITVDDLAVQAALNTRNTSSLLEDKKCITQRAAYIASLVAQAKSDDAIRECDALPVISDHLILLTSTVSAALKALKDGVDKKDHPQFQQLLAVNDSIKEQFAKLPRPYLYDKCITTSIRVALQEKEKNVKSGAWAFTRTLSPIIECLSLNKPIASSMLTALYLCVENKDCINWADEKPTLEEVLGILSDIKPDDKRRPLATVIYTLLPPVTPANDTTEYLLEEFTKVKYDNVIVTAYNANNTQQLLSDVSSAWNAILQHDVISSALLSRVETDDVLHKTKEINTAYLPEEEGERKKYPGPLATTVLGEKRRTKIGDDWEGVNINFYKYHCACRIQKAYKGLLESRPENIGKYFYELKKIIFLSAEEIRIDDSKSTFVVCLETMLTAVEKAESQWHAKTTRGVVPEIEDIRKINIPKNREDELTALIEKHKSSALTHTDCSDKKRQVKEAIQDVFKISLAYIYEHSIVKRESMFSANPARLHRYNNESSSLKSLGRDAFKYQCSIQLEDLRDNILKKINGATITEIDRLIKEVFKDVKIALLVAQDEIYGQTDYFTNKHRKYKKALEDALMKFNECSQTLTLAEVADLPFENRPHRREVTTRGPGSGRTAETPGSSSNNTSNTSTPRLLQSAASSSPPPSIQKIPSDDALVLISDDGIIADAVSEAMKNHTDIRDDVTRQLLENNYYIAESIRINRFDLALSKFKKGVVKLQLTDPAVKATFISALTDANKNMVSAIHLQDAAGTARKNKAFFAFYRGHDEGEEQARPLLREALMPLNEDGTPSLIDPLLKTAKQVENGVIVHKVLSDLSNSVGSEKPVDASSLYILRNCFQIKTDEGGVEQYVARDFVKVGVVNVQAIAALSNCFSVEAESENANPLLHEITNTVLSIISSVSEETPALLMPMVNKLCCELYQTEKVEHALEHAFSIIDGKTIPVRKQTSSGLAAPVFVKETPARKQQVVGWTQGIKTVFERSMNTFAKLVGEENEFYVVRGAFDKVIDELNRIKKLAQPAVAPVMPGHVGKAGMMSFRLPASTDPFIEKLDSAISVVTDAKNQWLQDISSTLIFEKVFLEDAISNEKINSMLKGVWVTLSDEMRKIVDADNSKRRGNASSVFLAPKEETGEFLPYTAISDPKENMLDQHLREEAKDYRFVYQLQEYKKRFEADLKKVRTFGDAAKLLIAFSEFLSDRTTHPVTTHFQQLIDSVQTKCLQPLLMHPYFQTVDQGLLRRRRLSTVSSEPRVGSVPTSFR